MRINYDRVWELRDDSTLTIPLHKSEGYSLVRVGLGEWRLHKDDSEFPFMRYLSEHEVNFVESTIRYMNSINGY